jgi:PKD domain/WD40-like Beta Propeller Repeat
MKFIAPILLAALLVACPSPNINPAPSTNRAPIAVFSISSNPANINTSLNLNASTSSDPDGDVLTYSWNFGDGGTATGVTTSHTFATTGRFTIGLTVSDGKLSNNTTQNLTINPVNSSLGKITYTYQNNVYRVNAQTGATPENVSALITPSSERNPERRLNISPNGAWLILETRNLEAVCADQFCLAVAPSANPASVVVVRAPDPIQNNDGFPSISNDGNLIVYPASGGAHSRDLWALTKTGNTWAAPVQITQTSSFAWNDQPSFSSDGTKILFDCGSEPNATGASNICEIATSGTGFRVVVTPSFAASNIASKKAVHHADYAPDGSIVFEADWDGEQIWKMAANLVMQNPNIQTRQVSHPPITRVSSLDTTNDNSPCVLANGQIASLWLGRAGNNVGNHELKMMKNDGSSNTMIVTGIDIDDLGIGCGG